jgi:hypothetical protein
MFNHCLLALLIGERLHISLEFGDTALNFLFACFWSNSSDNDN